MAIDYIEFRLYNATASSYTLLPNFVNASFDVKYNDIGVLNIEYPLTEAKALGLVDQALIGVIIGFSDGTIAEADRYIVFSTSENKLADGTRTRKTSARSSLTFLEDAVVYPSNWPVTAPTGHEFIGQTPGTMWRTLIDRAQARGALANIVETSFSGPTDSNGTPWALTMDRNFATNTGYLQILQDFMAQGYVDAEMVGWNLRLYNGGTRGNHIGIGVLEVRPSRNVSEMDISTDSTESCSTVLVEGEEGTAVERHNSSVQTLLGRRRERGVSQGGIADSGTLNILGDGELALRGKVNTEETVGLALTSSTTPFKDFTVADWVWVRYDGDSAPVERRVRQLALSIDQNRTITAGLTLNSIIFENEIRLQRKLEAYAGSGSNYGSQPNTGIDNTVPNAPSSLTLGSAPFVDTSGVYASAVSATWTAPTTNVDGTAITDLAGYEVQWRYVGDTVWSMLMPSDDNVHQWSPVAPGRQIQVQVRAYDQSGHRSSFTATATHTVAVDTTAPPAPTTPVVTNKLASVEVKWDGLAVSGGMDADVIRVEVWRSGTSGFVPQDVTSSLAGNLVKGGDTKVLYGPYGTPIYVKLVAVDRAGNRSPASAQGSGTPLKVGAGDITPGATPSDGLAPTGAPTVTFVGGIGALFARWTAVLNTDPVVYEVHLSTTNAFTPGAGTLHSTVDGNSLTMRTLPNNAALIYGTTYYVKVRAKDADGVGPSSTQQSAEMVQVNSPDIAVNYVYAGQILVDQLISGSLTADVTLSSIMRTGLTGARVEIGPFGIVTYAADNTPQTVLPSGSGMTNTFKGMIESAGATFTGGVSFRSQTNELSRDSILTLVSGVTSPPQQPSVVVDWAKVAVTADNGTGMWIDSTNAWATHWDAGSTSLSLISYDLTTGSQTGSLALTGGPAVYLPGGGVVKVGSFWYTLSQSLSDGNWYLIRWNSSGVFQNGSVYNPVSGTNYGWYWTDRLIAKMQLAYRPAAGNIVIAEFDPGAGNFRLDHRDPTTCASVSSATTVAVAGFTGPVGGVTFGSFDYGSERMALTSRNNGNIWIFNPASSFSYSVSESFPAASGMVTGLAWDTSAGVFRTAAFLSDLSAMYTYTNINWGSTASDGNWWVGFSWYDSVGTTHETTMSPIANFAMKKRARFRLTSTAIPVNGVDDPDSARFYLGRGSSLPATTSMYLQIPTGSLTQAQTFVSAVFSGTNPPTVSTFPANLVPGKIKDSGGNTLLSGDGTSELQGLTLGGIEVFAPQLVRKPSDTTVTNNATIQSDPHLKWTALANAVYFVEIMALVTQNANATGADFKVGFTMPAGASWSGGGPSGDPSSLSGTAVGSGNWAASLITGAGTLTYGINGTFTPIQGFTAVFLYATVLMGATGGTVSFAWAQGTATAAVGTLVKLGSFLRASRIS